MKAGTSVTSQVITDLPKFVSRVLLSAKHGNTDVNLWRSYSKDIVDNVHGFDSNQAAQLLGAFSYMRYRHRGVLEALSTRVYESCHKLTGSEISKVLRAYSILEHKDGFMFRFMLPEIAKRHELFKIGDLASVFYSYSNVGYYNRHLAQTVEFAVVHNLHEVRPRDLSQIMSALGKLRIRHKRLETILGCHFCKLIELCTHTEFSLIVNALGRIEFCQHPHLFSVVETEIYRKLKYFPAQVFSLVANAVSRRSESGKVVDFMAKEASGRLKEFDIHSMCLLSSAFSRRGHIHSELFERMANRLGRVSLCLYPRALASLTFAYGRAGHLHGPLMHFSGKHLEMFPEHYTCNEAAMVLRAHNLLNIRNETMLLSLARFICETYPDLVPVEPIDTLKPQRVSEYMELPCAPRDSSDVTSSQLSIYDWNQHQDEDETKHINHLEVVSPDPFNTESSGKNFLDRGLMHSLLWIVQGFAQHAVWNEREVKGALQRIANEIACRPWQLTPLTTSNLLFAYSRLNYRLETLLGLLIREIEDPRLNQVYEQEHLRLVYDALITFGIDPATKGVHRVPSIELKRLMEQHSNDIGKAVKDILNQRYSVLTNTETEEILEIKVPYAKEEGSPGSLVETAITYVHIPLCVGVSSLEGHSSAAFAEQLKYNFAI